MLGYCSLVIFVLFSTVHSPLGIGSFYFLHDITSVIAGLKTAICSRT